MPIYTLIYIRTTTKCIKVGYLHQLVDIFVHIFQTVNHKGTSGIAAGYRRIVFVLTTEIWSDQKNGEVFKENKRPLLGGTKRK